MCANLKKSLVIGIMISYKFLDTQECGSNRGKDTLFGRTSGVQVVCPSEPEGHVVGHGCDFRICGDSYRDRTVPFGQLERTALVYGILLPCYSRWEMPFGF